MNFVDGTVAVDVEFDSRESLRQLVLQAPDHVGLEGEIATAEATFTAPAATPRTRENSKQAEVIRMLRRPEGATIRQICEATGWQQHTVRGTFAGAFKKKLGMTLTSDKHPGAERVYRVA